MKLITFILLSLAGLGGGLVVGLSSLPSYEFDRLQHMATAAIGGAVAGMAAGAFAVWIAGGSSKKD